MQKKCINIKWIPSPTISKIEVNAGRCLILVVIFGVLFSQNASASVSKAPELTISYYYNNPCASCHDDKDFRDMFIGLVGDLAQGVTLNFKFFNVFHEEDQKKFAEICQSYRIPPDRQTTPLIMIGNTFLNGNEEIDKRLVSVFIDEKKNVLQRAAISLGTASRIIYFYISPCEECAEIEQYLNKLAQSFTVDFNGKKLDSLLIIDSYNVSEKKNLQLINQYFRYYRVPEARQKVPIIFLRDGYLSGRKEIENKLQSAIVSGRCIGIAPLDGQSDLKAYEWSTIFLIGLINGFNPCSISMLLFLATILLSRKANVLKCGIFFIIGKFSAYLALGTILFNLLAAINNNIFKLFSDIGKYILLVFSLIIAAININDFFASKSERYNKIRLQLPVRLRKLNHKWLNSISRINNDGIVLMFAVFIMGFAISIGEFLCTGQIYLATILYMLKSNSAYGFKTMVSFLVYIISMLIPIFAITLTVHKSKEVFRVSEFARGRMPLIKIINAGVFLAFVVIILLF